MLPCANSFSARLSKLLTVLFYLSQEAAEKGKACNFFGESNYHDNIYQNRFRPPGFYCAG